MKKCTDRVCFLDCGVDVSVEVELPVYMDSQVFRGLNFFQMVAMDGVLTDNWVSFVCYSQDLTFGGMELHLPLAFPVLESVQVFLEFETVLV